MFLIKKEAHGSKYDTEMLGNLMSSVLISAIVVCRKRKHAVVSDATSGSDAETSHASKKKRSAVIGSGSEDSNAGEAKGSGDEDEKEPAGMVI